MTSARLDRRNLIRIGARGTAVAAGTVALASPFVLAGDKEPAPAPSGHDRHQMQTGTETDTDLIGFALAAIAVDDNFPTTFKESRGKVDPVLKPGFRGVGIRFRRSATLGAARSAADAGTARRRRASIRRCVPDGRTEPPARHLGLHRWMEDRSSQVLDDLIANVGDYDALFQPVPTGRALFHCRK